MAVLLGLSALLNFSGVALAAGPAASVSVQLSPGSVLAGGSASSTVTATVLDAGGMPVSGESVSLFSSDKGITFSPNPARDSGSGTYTSTLTSSLQAGRVPVLALDGSLLSLPAFLTQTAASTTSLAVVTNHPAGYPTVTNQGVSLVATVAANPSNIAPVGTVAFVDGGTLVPGCEGLPTPAQTNPVVVVTCGTSFAATATPAQLTAAFAPGAGSLVMGSMSPLQSFAIAKDSTSTSVTMLGSRGARVGTEATLSAVVNPSQPGPWVPTGSVEFTDHGRPVRSCSAQPVTASLTALCKVTYQKPGLHDIAAAYSGDPSFGNSTSAPVTVAVQALGTITATMQWTFYHTPAYTQIVALSVHGAPRNATLIVACHGRGCPFRKRVIVTGRTRPCAQRRRRPGCAPNPTIDLASPWRHRDLRPGAKIIVELLKLGWIGKKYTFTIRADSSPRVGIK